MIYNAPLTYAKIAAITPSDGVDIPKLVNTTASTATAGAPFAGAGGFTADGTATVSPNAVWITGAGNLAGQVGGVVAPIVPVVAGQILAVQFSRILLTGTTATGIFGLWL